MCLKSDSKLERGQRARDKLVLRRELPNMLGFVGGIFGDRDLAERVFVESKNVPDFLSRAATVLEQKSGTESYASVEVLGLISDLALRKMTCEERAEIPFETPSQIVLWFRDYLLRTLDKRSRLDGEQAQSSAGRSAFHRDSSCAKFNLRNTLPASFSAKKAPCGSLACGA